MTIKYPYWANVITTDKDIANQLAAAIDPDDGSTTFGRLRLVNGQGGAAWFASFPLTASGKAFFDEFNGAGPYPMLAALGFNDVPAIKPSFIIEHGNREGLMDRFGAFIGENGYAVDRVAR